MEINEKKTRDGLKLWKSRNISLKKNSNYNWKYKR